MMVLSQTTVSMWCLLSKLLGTQISYHTILRTQISYINENVNTNVTIRLLLNQVTGLLLLLTGLVVQSIYSHYLDFLRWFQHKLCLLVSNFTSFCSRHPHLFCEVLKMANFSHRLLSPPVLLTALGAIIFSVSFFGCCGAIKESHVLTR